jgi:hypothetical protein
VVRAASPQEVADVSNTGFTNADLTVDYLLRGSLAGAFPIHVGTDPGIDYINTETFTVSFYQNELTIKFLVNRSYIGDSGTDGLTITDATNNLAALRSVTPGSSNPAGYTVNLSADGIDVHWQGASFQAGDTITLDFGFAPTNPPVAADAAFSTGEDTPPRATTDGAQVPSFLSGLTDADNGATPGIAITALTDSGGGGTWQYSLNDVSRSALSRPRHSSRAGRLTMPVTGSSTTRRPATSSMIRTAATFCPATSLASSRRTST